MIVFVIVIVIGLITLKNPRLTYKLTPQQTIEMLSSGVGCVHPYQLVPVLHGTVDTIVLFDIRNRFEFGKGHIPGAENITAYDLTNQENIDRLNDLRKNGIAVVIYGNNQLEANGPWMVFRQLGFDNVNILLGGYDYFKTHQNDLLQTKGKDDYIKGIPRYDYAKMASKSNVAATPGTGTAKKPVVIKRKKKSAVAGGC